ncbi:MAG TPA: hypothetical protein VHM30_19860 [Gemmatimonadaceae bacterium]|nr:hypothetical protein [Gemmatimonadaceae bacterium]
MVRALCRLSLFVVLVLGAARVALAQRPGSVEKPRPRETEDASVKGRQPAATPAPVMNVPASGRYRVVLAGFRVNNESYDTFLETDGKGDEIRLNADVQEFGPDGQPLGAVRRLQTVIYGDRNKFPSRITAGSRSAKGGLQTLDNVPAVRDPWVVRDAPQPDHLPLLLWEGELRTGQNLVAIAPTVWELDSDDALNPANMVLALGDIGNNVLPVAQRLPGVGALSELLITGAKPAFTVATMVKESGNRPIGLSPGTDGYNFVPQIVALTTRSAELALAGSGGARSAGVVEVRYRDAAELKGDYSLFLRIERLP